jgi:uncharacterized membrane protein YphA (DoxX/SURF4 family)
MMQHTFLEIQKNALLLITRVLLMILFILFGWDKLTSFPDNVACIDLQARRRRRFLPSSR